MKTAQYWIEKLEMEKHPEGGYFKETYRSDQTLKIEGLPARFSGDRSASTCILYLLEKDDFSSFHRIASDEIWHFYTGTSALEVLELSFEGDLLSHKLGSNFENGEYFQAMVPAGAWFGARLADQNENAYALVGCTVAPGFDFEDFEMAKSAELMEIFPTQKEIIEKMCRQ
ncbi:cupin domain-containing protein [Sediminitomix flava]|uniref:DUF985 domain-containing protein n=1 Tax=Sediminitomix flava TaxID=379075 RepID=A0A315ZBA9_SEDFL|nr:cupin domain-containing protein [Sediminitomix flava]PWJ42831.1 hypothetical protein BC781_102377 [Sediminitomix flava]